ncbi:MAG TPA: DUF2334 domain-containing protein [Candidatus Limnocylindria bacterium]|nr:DUF2334 domain-containing protein [Candidatus Limnocylindria bacterium]
MLIVSIHDVAPSTLADVRWLLSRLDEVGVVRRVLKVIPGEEGAAADARAELGRLVTDEAARGSEIVLHGWSHRAVGPRRGGLLDRLRARLFAGDSAEFLALDPAGMQRRLADGQAWLAALGVNARGFCAPGWLAAPELPSIARRAGFDYLVWLRGLQVLADQGERWQLLPPIGYMGAGRGQEALVRLGAAVVSGPLLALRRSHVRRVFVHPQRASTSPDCARVLREVAILARRVPSVTYGDLVDA